PPDGTGDSGHGSPPRPPPPDSARSRAANPVARPRSPGPERPRAPPAASDQTRPASRWSRRSSRQLPSVVRCRRAVYPPPASGPPGLHLPHDTLGVLHPAVVDTVQNLDESTSDLVQIFHGQLGLVQLARLQPALDASPHHTLDPPG